MTNDNTLRIDITGKEGTYTNALLSNNGRLSDLSCDRKVGLEEYRQAILDMVQPANDTPAKAKFVQNVRKQRTKDGVVFVVYQAILAGSGNALGDCR